MPTKDWKGPVRQLATTDIVEAHRKDLHDLIHRDVRFMFEYEDEHLRGLQLLRRFLEAEITRVERVVVKQKREEEAA
jgi:hypothetical protein